MLKNWVLAAAHWAWVLPGIVLGMSETAAARAVAQGRVVVAALPAADGPEEEPPARISVGAALDLEGAPVVLRIVAPSPTFASILSGAGLLSRMRMTSGFGLRLDPFLGTMRMHRGLDLAAPRGTPVPASGAGTVAAAGWMGGYGNGVVVNHGNGVETRYGHLSSISVTAGQRVAKGEILGRVGSTGRSTGNHLHYEVRQAGHAVNPASLSGREAARVRF